MTNVRTTKVRRLLTIVISLALVLAFSTLASFSVSASATTPEASVSESSVKAAVQDLFNARCQVILGGNPSQLDRFYASNPGAVGRLDYDKRYLVRSYVEPYAHNQHIIYTCNYELKDWNISLNGRTAQVSVLPVLRYQWGRPEWPERETTVESDGPHHMTMQLDGPSISIVAHEYTDFFKGQIPDRPYKPGVIVNEGRKPAPGAFTPKKASNKGAKLLEEQRKTQQGQGDLSIQSTAVTYDFVAAAQYAYNWALSYNPAYPQLDLDCTNFASQAVHDSSGGKAPFTDECCLPWWVGKDASGQWSWTSAWAAVPDYRAMLLTAAEGPRGAEVGDPNVLLRGDMIIYEFGGDSTWDHTTVVTGYAPDGTPLVSYHSNPTQNRAWNDIGYAQVSGISMNSTFYYNP